MGLYFGSRPAVILLFILKLYQTAIYHNPYCPDLDDYQRTLAMRQATTDTGIACCLLLLAGSRKLKYVRLSALEDVLGAICEVYVGLIRAVISGVATGAIGIVNFAKEKVSSRIR